MSENGLKAAEEKMRDARQPDEAIRSFASAYRRLVAGESAMLPTAELEPAGDVDTLEELPEADAGVLDRVAVIKLNGGLATTMGLRSPKSLVEARDGRSFLDIIIGNTLALRQRYGVRLPLVLMNSEATRADTARALESHPDLDTGLPVSFMQSMEPKLDAESLAPVSWPPEPSLEWCPPGHGDVYSSLRSSGMLDALLEHGFHYAMIANADNLGAATDARIAGHMERGEIPFLMEVVEGTEADRKGGHIAQRRADGQLVLRETAQTPPEDQEAHEPAGRPIALLQHEQPVGRSPRVEGEARPHRRRARAAADHQPQDRRSARLELTAGDPARERDGCRDRQL